MTNGPPGVSRREPPAASIAPGTESALRTAAWFASVAGAAVSLGLMFYVGRRQPSVLLMVLFTGWVLGPYAGFWIADRWSRAWSPLERGALYIVMLVSAIGSVAVYALVVFGPPRPKPAFYFLVVPVAAWLLAAIVIPTAARLGRR